jgi:membrane protease YdiL (CAAX protease family)
MVNHGAAVTFSLVGGAAVAFAWLLVRGRFVSIWAAGGSVLGLLGLVSLASGLTRPATDVSLGLAAGIGAGAGVALYLGTLAFMAKAASRWPRLRQHTEELYARREDRTTSHALGSSLFVIVPGEELFWRGMVQTTAAASFGPVGGALVAWAGYVAANAAMGSLPILLGAVVGGAVWTGLALWSGGVVAGIACHAVWTGLMILRPPR